MRHTIIALGASFAALLTPTSVRVQPAPAITSTTVELPSGDALFPGGSSADAVNNNCLACHSAGMVLTQPHLSRVDWQAEVEKMRNAYKAPIADADVPAIVDYLANLKSAN